MTKQDPEGTKDIEAAIKSAINLCKSMAGRKRALKMIAYEFCEDSYSDGFQAGAQWQAERGWVRIEDFPPEWKDGREVDVFIDMGKDGTLRIPNSKFQNGVWLRPAPKSFNVLYGGYFYPIEHSDEYGVTKITHVMLPPNTPKGNA